MCIDNKQTLKPWQAEDNVIELDMELGNVDGVTQPVQEAGQVEGLPQVTFQSVTFSDNTTIHIESGDVVVLVGPNNAGKSLALRELEGHVGGEPASKVVTGASLRRDGSKDSFVRFVREFTRIESQEQAASVSIQGYGISLGIGGTEISTFWPDSIGPFRSLFCQRISTENRIKDSNSPDAIDPFTERPTHPVHLLYDDQVEEKLGSYFKLAFGTDLILYRGVSKRSHLLVGQRPALKEGEDRVTGTYVKRLMDTCERLEEEGDGMRSFASVILHLLAPVTSTILLLDEPEAFLHPPQARLLGEVIAKEKPADSQLFVATHSSDVLEGLMGVAPQHLRVIRMQRDSDGSVNRVKQLDRGLVQQISRDPLMRYSSILSGVFHERVILCESDADCMFYSAVLNVPSVRGEQYPDVLFTHCNGYDRMAKLAQALVSLDVPVDVVMDMDVLRNTPVLRGIVESLGGSWSVIGPSAEAVKTAVDAQKGWLTVDEVKDEIRRVLDSSEHHLSRLKREVDSQFGKGSPWHNIKTSGEAALPGGEPVLQFKRLQSLCKSIGLWIVPVGELERFCTSVGGHGANWARSVLEMPNFPSNAELEDARKFVHEIWITRTPNDGSSPVTKIALAEGESTVAG